MLLALAYVLLVVFRIAWVFLPQTGYIHPDEFFQFSERVAADVLGYETVPVWEFDAVRPLRSVFFPFLICGLPFAVLRELGAWLSGSLSGYWLLVAPRLVMAALSLVVDKCVHSVCRALSTDPLPPLLLFASSYAATVLCTRTLTNAVETVLFALLLALVVRDARLAGKLRRVSDQPAVDESSEHEQQELQESEADAAQQLAEATVDATSSNSDSAAAATPDEACPTERHQHPLDSGQPDGRLHTGSPVSGGPPVCTSDQMPVEAEEKEEVEAAAQPAAAGAGDAAATAAAEPSARSTADRGRAAEAYRAVQSNNFLIVTVAVAGFFNRPTFLAFAAAPCCFWILGGARGAPLRPGDLVRSLLLCLYCVPFACNVAIMLALWDTYYYYRAFDSTRLLTGSLVLTPLNFLTYNSDPANLAEHGTHPRYLHAVVNVPLLLGPAVPLVVAAAALLAPAQSSSSPAATATVAVGRMLVASFFLPLLCLSAFPHQEPRFLLPLVVPAALLAGAALRRLLPGRRLRGTFALAWLTFNVMGAALYGVAHQGGIVPALLRLGEGQLTACHHQRIEVIFYHTYMPPLHLLGRSPAAATSPAGGSSSRECELVMRDLKGANSSALERELRSAGEAIVVTPLAEADLDLGGAYKVSLVARFFPHVTFEDLPPVRRMLSVLPNGRLNRTATLDNMKRAFSLSVYRVVDLLYEYERHGDKQGTLSVVISTAALRS